MIDGIQSNNYDNISKNIVGYSAFIPARAPKQVDI